MLTGVFPRFSRYTQAFTEYQGILEQHIERLIQECNTTNEEFIAALKANSDEEKAIYVDIILSADNYPEFIRCMIDYKRN